MKIESLHRNLPSTRKVEITDAIQLFLRANADQQMRHVIHFNDTIDFDLLKFAVRLSIYQEPIFSYYYCEEKNKAFWKKKDDINIDEVVQLIQIKDSIEDEFNKFMTKLISPFDFPLVNIRVFRNANKDILCVNMNHTPTDGVGLKEFVRIISYNYNKLIENPDFIPTANIQGNRSINQITKRFNCLEKFNFLKNGMQKPPMKQTWSFDWGEDNENKKNDFALISINTETFDIIKSYGKKHNATINDIVIAAFSRAFVKTNSINSSASKSIVVPVNLRKYLDKPSKTAICSLTGSMILRLGDDIGETFDDTLQKVVNASNYNKKNNTEMNMLIPFVFFSKITPYDKLKETTMNRKMPFIPLITNIGVISPDDINFNNTPISNSYITGVVSYNNYFSMAFSSFNKVITFSIGFCGNEKQKKKIQMFLLDFKTELESIK